VGKGTGQGLSLVYAVVERHEGSIDIISNEGEGTTIRMRLPVETIEEAGVDLNGG
jgi:signal transduction histidine kinase